jgi:hypothetical protein
MRLSLACSSDVTGSLGVSTASSDGLRAPLESRMRFHTPAICIDLSALDSLSPACLGLPLGPHTPYSSAVLNSIPSSGTQGGTL